MTSASDKQLESRPVVLVVEAEAVFRGLEEALSGDIATLVLAQHAAQARIAAGSRRPAVVIVPAPGGRAPLGVSLREVLPKHARILGLGEVETDQGLPEGVDRLVSGADLEGVKAALEALLGEARNAGSGLAAALGLPELRLGSAGSDASERLGEPEEPEADIDPSRAAAIRDLGMAIRMHRAISGGAGTTAPASAPGIALQQPDREDPSQVDISVGTINDALSSLPDPSQAVSRTERMMALTAEREAELALKAQAAALAQIRADAEGPATSEAPSPVVPRRRRTKLWMGLGLIVLCLAGGGVGGYLYWKHREDALARANRPPPPERLDEALLAQAAAAAKRGTLVDPYAGLAVHLPAGLRSGDVDQSDEGLHRSVPELDRWFERALARLPAAKAREQLLGRAEPLVRFDDLKRAERYIERAIKVRDGADARQLLAEILEKRGQLAEARRELLRALKLAPRKGDLEVRLGQLYLKEGKTQEGCEVLRRAAKREPSARALLREHCGQKGGGR